MARITEIQVGAETTTTVMELTQKDVVEQIIVAIEQGVDEWQMPWNNTIVPANVASRNLYGGWNMLVLAGIAHRYGYCSNVWGTPNQWTRKGATIREGAIAAPVWCFFPIRPGKDHAVAEDGRDSGRWSMKCHRVINADEVEGWQNRTANTGGCPPSSHDIEAATIRANAFVDASGAAIRYGGDSAYYDPVRDRICMPVFDDFTGTPTSSPAESFYGTLLHELVHWTGADSRCKRDFGRHWGDPAYAMEELVAEIGAAFLCTELGVSSRLRPDHAAYVDRWLQAIRKDNNAIIRAARRATRAVNFLKALQRRKTKPVRRVRATNDGDRRPPGLSVRPS